VRALALDQSPRVLVILHNCQQLGLFLGRSSETPAPGQRSGARASIASLGGWTIPTPALSQYRSRRSRSRSARTSGGAIVAAKLSNRFAGKCETPVLADKASICGGL
jgi:hypothetical protein